MKKINFAVQVFILAAAFPVLFVSGINDHSKKTKQVGKPLQEAVARSGRSSLKKDLFAK